MKKLSGSTLFQKRIFPVIWVGFSAIFFLVALLNPDEKGLDWQFMAFSIFMLVNGLFWVRKSTRDLIDHVYDEGDSLLFRTSRKEVRVALQDIKNVNYPKNMENPRITISVRHETQLGTELSFVPNSPIIGVSIDKGIESDVAELIGRIERASKLRNN